jgi:DNA recombination protein RmuC
LFEEGSAIDTILIILIIAGAALGAAVVFFLLRGKGGEGDPRLLDSVDRIAAAQESLAGRLEQIASSSATSQNHLNERLHAQERALAKALEERLEKMTKRLGEGLEKQASQTASTMGDLRERLVKIDEAQRNITTLSAQVVSLQDVLANKQARGAFGEVQLSDLVRGILPPSAYEFQATVGDGRRADCLLKLPNPPGPIAIDAKFPLESYHALRGASSDTEKAAAERAFRTAMQVHIRNIADKYIVPGETAESALLFLPSEAVYAELHSNFLDVVEKSYRARVWIVSPTTLMATLNTVRAVLKDVHMREQAGVIQKEVHLLLEDVMRLDDRVGNLEKHFRKASEYVQQIQTSAGKIMGRGEKIEALQFEEAEGEVPGKVIPGETKEARTSAAEAAPDRSPEQPVAVKKPLGEANQTSSTSRSSIQ